MSDVPYPPHRQMSRLRLRSLSQANTLRITVTVVIALVLVGVLLWRFTSATRAVVATQHAHQSVIGRLVGQTAPDFTFHLWNGTPGQTVHLEALRGKAVVLNFWASWCTPCQGEAPILASAAQKYTSQGVVFLGVALETQDADGQQFVRQYHIPYACGPAPDSTAVAYGLTGIPVTVAVNRQGVLVQQISGPVTANSLDAAIRTALG